jgi:hypothetical protein
MGIQRADADKVESDADGIPEKRINTSTTATADATLAADAVASLGTRSQLNVYIRTIQSFSQGVCYWCCQVEKDTHKVSI